jgi:pimeloyl-ACP methyl ester carboxylesterase
MLRKAICLFLLIFSNQIEAMAQERPRGSLGVVLLHGKGGQPGGNILGLTKSLESEGVKVITPVMAWSGSRGQPFNYDKTYEAALREIDGAVSKLRGRGATKIIIAGQSLGANAALAYVARKPSGISGVIMLAPGQAPERMRFPGVQSAQAKAQQMIAAGQGLQQAEFPDVNVGQRFTVSGTYAGWYSYYDPEGAANMPKNAARLRGLPLLYVVGRSDPIYALGRGYIFEKANKHSKSRYVEIDADHLDTPDKARPAVLDWLKSL